MKKSTIRLAETAECGVDSYVSEYSPKLFAGEGSDTISTIGLMREEEITFPEKRCKTDFHPLSEQSSLLVRYELHGFYFVRRFGQISDHWA